MTTLTSIVTLALGLLSLLTVALGGLAAVKSQTAAQLRSDMSDLRAANDDLRNRDTDRLAELGQLRTDLAAATAVADNLATRMTGERRLVAIEDQLENHHQAAMARFDALLATLGERRER